VARIRLPHPATRLHGSAVVPWRRYQLCQAATVATAIPARALFLGHRRGPAEGQGPQLRAGRGRKAHRGGSHNACHRALQEGGSLKWDNLHEVIKLSRSRSPRRWLRQHQNGYHPLLQQPMCGRRSNSSSTSARRTSRYRLPHHYPFFSLFSL
jgi:hypothetical protein